MSSGVFSHCDPRKLSSSYHSKLSSNLMGSRISAEQNRYPTSSSEHGKYSNKMGSAASSGNDHVIKNARHPNQRHGISDSSRYSNREEDHGKMYGKYSRPLPNGPGPLFPTTPTRRNIRKQEAISTQSKGPMKGNHLLPLNGISPKPDSRHISYERGHLNLSRAKSRSLGDVRDVMGNNSGKPQADKLAFEADMKKAKKAFQISRSPSCENIMTRKVDRNYNDRVILDKLSKTSTDNRDSYGRKPTCVQSSSKGDYVDTTANTNGSPNRSPIYQPDFSSEVSSFRHNVGMRDDRQEKNAVSSKPRHYSRQTSDSAYESNCSTGSSSGQSSPGMSREQQSDGFSSKNPTQRYGKGLVGLRNLGNTCFMNSILQCLRCSIKLRSVLCDEGVMEKLVETAHRNKGSLTRAFTNVVREIWSPCNSGSTVTPNALKSQVQRYAPRFVGYNQQDCQEFLRFLLEGLHDDLNTSTEKAKRQYPDVSKLSDAEQARISWDIYERRERSLISDFFVGQLKSTLTCTECDFRSLTFDPFWDLSLPIPTRSHTSLLSGKVSLYDCFKKFTQEETLDGDEKPTCERCKKRRKCLKQFSIERFPQILVIHLKRFSGMRYRTKLETLVDFPFDLNLLNYAANNSHKKYEAKYRLFGVSNHSGGTYSGHYTAYCKHPDSHEWFCFSDSLVSRFSQSKVISDEAYVLFYELSNQMSYL